jgi:hypothetical protein
MSTKHESAHEWGLRRKSCRDALAERMALGPDATQADWWLACSRGDWLLWQLQRLPADELRPMLPALHRATDRVVGRAIRRARKSLRGMRTPWATTWRRWARRWLSGEDRSAAASRAVWEASAASREAEASAWKAAWEAARAAEWAARAAEWAARAEAWASAAWAWAAEVAAWASAWEAELELQARDIRREIPVWPGR